MRRVQAGALLRTLDVRHLAVSFILAADCIFAFIFIQGLMSAVVQVRTGSNALCGWRPALRRHSCPRAEAIIAHVLVDHLIGPLRLDVLERRQRVDLV